MSHIGFGIAHGRSRDGLEIEIQLVEAENGRPLSDHHVAGRGAVRAHEERVLVGRLDGEIQVVVGEGRGR